MDTLNSDKTLPPRREIRYPTVAELFAQMAPIGTFLTERPEEDEGFRSFLDRLRNSATPEEAVTFIAFAVETHAAIQWGLDCVLALQDDLSSDDTLLINWVANWLDDPSHEARWKTLQMALFAPRLTPLVGLGLAVGWSGGPLAPNDKVAVPAWRAPRAVSSAVLQAISQAPPDRRAVNLNFVLDKAAGLLRIA